MPKIAGPKEKAAPGKAVAGTVVDKLKADIIELQGDLIRLAELCGRIWGEPLASAAQEIAKKRQGAA